MSKQIEAMKLALEALEGIHPGNLTPMAEEYWKKAATALREALAEQPAQQEPVACSVCDQVHSILDGDESKIIRNAKDGYPDGRSPRILTLKERVMALCRYASDWKRWCLEKENTSPPAQPLTDEQITKCWGQVEGTRHGYVAFARAIEAAHGITSGCTTTKGNT